MASAASPLVKPFTGSRAQGPRCKDLLSCVVRVAAKTSLNAARVNDLPMAAEALVKTAF